MPTAQDAESELAMQGGALDSSVIGGAMLPHAPQFLTIPETEDRETVERVGRSLPRSAPG